MDYTVVYATDSTGRIQKMNFLTEIGLYKMTMRSNKPFALIFQDWVFGVIKQIRLNGKFESDEIQTKK